MEVQIYHVMQPGVHLEVDSQFPPGLMVRHPSIALYAMGMKTDDRNCYYQ